MFAPSKIGRIYNWRPDLPDYRDVPYRAAKPVPLPRQVDLRAHCSPVEDQGALGSCTGQAFAAALEFVQNKEGEPFRDMSRLFIYYIERHAEGTIHDDAGAYIRDGAKGLAMFGCCTEDLWPYDIARFADMPPAAAFADALTRKVTAYRRIVGLRDMKQCLAEGYPFVFGFSVYSDFESTDTAGDGVLEMPKPRERSLGGHAVLAVGYDDDANVMIVRNSWGATWGMDGYFVMPYDYIGDPRLADDMWTIRAWWEWEDDSTEVAA